MLLPGLTTAQWELPAGRAAPAPLTLPGRPPACLGLGRCPQPWGHARTSSKGRDERPCGLDQDAASITWPRLPPPHSRGIRGPRGDQQMWLDAPWGLVKS